MLDFLKKDKGMFPLSTGQRCIEFVRILYPDGPANNIGGIFLLKGEMDFDVMRKALELFVQRNESIRLRLHPFKKNLSVMDVASNKVMQYISDDKEVDVGFHDFTGCTMQEMMEEVTRWDSEIIQVFDAPLYVFRMFKAPDGRGGVFVMMDHSITDAYNCMLSTKQVIQIYNALLNNTELPPKLNSYMDYLDKEQKYLKSPQYDEDKKFWKEQFKATPSGKLLYDSKKRDTYGHSKRLTFDIGAELTNGIDELSKKLKITHDILLTVMLGISRARILEEDDTFVGMGIMLRSTVKEKNTIGNMVNGATIKIKIEWERPFADFITDYYANCWLSQLRHMRYPIDHFKTDIYMMHHIEAFSDISISFPDTTVNLGGIEGVETIWLESGAFPSVFILYPVHLNDTGVMSFQYEYQTKHFDEAYITYFNTRYVEMLKKVIENPEIKVGEL